MSQSSWIRARTSLRCQLLIGFNSSAPLFKSFYIFHHNLRAFSHHTRRYLHSHSPGAIVNAAHVYIVWGSLVIVYIINTNGIAWRLIIICLIVLNITFTELFSICTWNLAGRTMPTMLTRDTPLPPTQTL